MGCRGKLWGLSIPGEAAATVGVKERPPGCRRSISVSRRVMSRIIAAQLGLRRWAWCCEVVPHLFMGLAKNSVIFFASLSEHV